MFTQALLLAAVSALASAQSSVLTFTHVPSQITDGQEQALTYQTNDTSSPVTIILRKGESNNLQTVQTLTTTAMDGQYVWTPSTSLADGDDYALEIKQGSQVNYYGPFSVEGCTVTSSSSSSAVGYMTSSSMMSSSMSPSGYVSVTANATTTVMPYGTAPGTSAGTGTAMPRNTTMSSATLSTMKSSSTPASMSASGTAAGSPTAATSGAGAASATSSSAASAALSGSSSLALVFGAIAAIFYLQ